MADLIFTENYPNEPPTMKFITPMWHPNSEHQCMSRQLTAFDHFTSSLPRRACLHIDPGQFIGPSRSQCAECLTLFLCHQHPPGEDQYGFEDAGERWLPVHTVTSIVSNLFCTRLYTLLNLWRRCSASFPYFLRTFQTLLVQRM